MFRRRNQVSSERGGLSFPYLLRVAQAARSGRSGRAPAARTATAASGFLGSHPPQPGGNGKFDLPYYYLCYRGGRQAEVKSRRHLMPGCGNTRPRYARTAVALPSTDGSQWLNRPSRLLSLRLESLLLAGGSLVEGSTRGELVDGGARAEPALRWHDILDGCTHFPSPPGAEVRPCCFRSLF